MEELGARETRRGSRICEWCGDDETEVYKFNGKTYCKSCIYVDVFTTQLRNHTDIDPVIINGTCLGCRKHSVDILTCAEPVDNMCFDCAVKKAISQPEPNIHPGYQSDSPADQPNLPVATLQDTLLKILRRRSMASRRSLSVESQLKEKRTKLAAKKELAQQTMKWLRHYQDVIGDYFTDKLEGKAHGKTSFQVLDEVRSGLISVETRLTVIAESEVETWFEHQSASSSGLPLEPVTGEMFAADSDPKPST